MFIIILSTFQGYHYGVSIAIILWGRQLFGLLHGGKIILSRYSYFYRWFQHFISSSIILNMISLSLFDYTDRTSTKQWNRILDKIDFTLSVIFIFEAAMKIFAMGFIIHKFSYLKQGWNVIDFLIAISG